MVELAKSQGFTESFLEFFMLKNFPNFFANDFVIYNQFRINLLGSKIDIIALSKKRILILELKRNTIKENDAQQLQHYVSWVKNNKILLKRFFKVNLEKAKIQSILIGNKIQKNINISNIHHIKKYITDNNKLTLINI